VYTPPMRRIQLYMDEGLDDALSAAAARSGRSRSELVRAAVRTWLGERDDVDPIDELIGAVDIEPVDDLDSVIYDR
jgi:metal-responsive CopG/Arc/MetJ family transcriptional regulator